MFSPRIAYIFPLLLFCLFLDAATVHGASLLPTGLQDAHLMPPGKGEFRLGFSYASGLHNQFQKEDRNRKVMENPSLLLNLGLGERVEAQFHYSYLHLQEDGQSDKFGSGDLTIAFKVRVLGETAGRPAMAVRFATKLPNADEHDDFGTDEMDFFTEFLFSRTFPRLTAHVNLGLAILGDPRTFADGQDDLMTYGIGFETPLPVAGLDLLVSAEGMTFGRSDGYNERGAVRAGVRFERARFALDFGGSIGYAARSEEWSTLVGVTFPFDLPENW